MWLEKIHDLLKDLSWHKKITCLDVSNYVEVCPLFCKNFQYVHSDYSKKRFISKSIQEVKNDFHEYVIKFLIILCTQLPTVNFLEKHLKNTTSMKSLINKASCIICMK